jgi:hypothetical protein
MNNKDDDNVESGSWPEYRKFVVSQLRETSDSMNDIKNAFAEHRIKMAALDAHLVNIINGTIDRRIESLESTRNWARGIGVVLGLVWSIILIFITRMVIK